MKFLPTNINLIFIIIVVILLIAMIINKVKQSQKTNSWKWKDIITHKDVKRLKQLLSENPCLYILRWILALSLGVAGYLITNEPGIFFSYLIFILGGIASACGGELEIAMKICILIQMLIMGFFVLVTISWQMALLFIPIALVGWFMIPNDAEEIAWY